MKSIGQTIKQVRKNKNMSQEYVSHTVCTSKYLSRLETNRHEASATIILGLMDRLNITPLELVVLWEDWIETHNKFLKRLDECVSSRDILELQNLYVLEDDLYKITMNIRHKHNKLIIESHINELLGPMMSKKGMKEIVDYLANIREFGMYEMLLLEQTIGFLSFSDAHDLTVKASKMRLSYKNEEGYTRLLFKILHRLAVKEIKLIKVQELIETIAAIEDLLSHQNMYYEKTELLYLKGLMRLLQGRRIEGERLCRESISVHQLLGRKEEAERYADELETYLARTIR